MTPGLASLVEIATAHAARFSELVTYSATGQQVSAVVNRKPTTSWKNDALSKQPQLLAAGFSEITLADTVLSEAPVAGQYFKDSANKVHRIQEINYSGFSWTCLCKVGSPV